MATLTDSANATTLDSSTTSATLELFRAVLGPVNTDYYLKAFTRFDAKDRAGPSWNWAAGLLTLNWMALRQLWGAALAYLGAVITAALLILGIGRLAFGLSMEAQVAWLLALIALSVVVPGVFGNAWLYNASRKKMEKALTVNATLADACAMLRRRAASRQRLIGLAIGNGVLLAGVAGLSFSFLNMQRPAAVQSPAPASSQASVPSPASSAIAAASAPAAVTATSAPVSIATSAPIAASAAASAPEMKQVSAPPTSAASAASTASAPHAPAAVTEPGKEAINKKRTDTKPATPAPAVSTPAKTKPKTEKVPVNESKSSSVPEHKFIVNVGLFADDNNARNAAAKLQDAGIAVLVNEIDTAKGKRTRVRAGPFASQAEAERAVDKIQFIGLDAVVVRK